VSVKLRVEWLFLGQSEPSPSTVEHRHGNVSVKVQPTSATLSTLHTNTDGDTNDDDTSASDNDAITKHFEGQGAAIIALSFGVSLTAVLVVYAACHFCRGRKGSWKGRRFHVDGEADYLVDGMYLWYSTAVHVIALLIVKGITTPGWWHVPDRVLPFMPLHYWSLKASPHLVDGM